MSLEQQLLDIIVLTSPHRECSVCTQLDKPHKIYKNSDWEFKQENFTFNMNALSLCTKQDLCYRCFKGHQEALKLADKPFICMLEDDAGITGSDWYDKVLSCIPLLSDFEVVQLFHSSIRPHQRAIKDGIAYHTIARHDNYGLKWATGSVAYLITLPTAEKIIQSPYTGLPMDLFLNNAFTSCCIEGQHFPFNHNDTVKSHFRDI